MQSHTYEVFNLALLLNGTFLSAAVCTENSVQLVSGLDRNAGRVEVCVLETWRTVCDRSWTSEDASVVCRQLGFSRWSKYSHNYEYEIAIYDVLNIFRCCCSGWWHISTG